MPKLKDYLASLIGIGTPTANDRVYWYDESGNASAGETFAAQQTRLAAEYLTKTAATGQYAPLANPTFTGNVVVPTADAANEATTKAQMDAADALKVSKAGDTMTGNLRIETLAFPTLFLKDTDEGNNQSYSLYVGSSGLVIASVNTSGGNQSALTISPNGAIAVSGGRAVSMKFASGVTVPAATTAEQAAQVTAIDAVTGRLAIGGREIGDTGWRNVAANLVNGWSTAGVGSGFFEIRRTGDVVVCRMRASAAAATSIDLYVTPAGFRSPNKPMGGIVTFPTGHTADTKLTAEAQLRTYVAATSATPTSTTVVASWVYTTTDAWPTVLPGIAAV